MTQDWAVCQWAGDMNLSTQQHIRALIVNLSDIPNHLDGIAREERVASTRAADDFCRAAELIRHAIGRLEMAARSAAVARPAAPCNVLVGNLGVVNQLRHEQVDVADDPLSLIIVP